MKKLIIIITIIFFSGMSYSEKAQKHNPLHPGTDDVFSDLFNAALDLKDCGKDDEFLVKMKQAYERAAGINADIPAAISLFYIGSRYISLNNVAEAESVLKRLEGISVKNKDTEETDYWYYALSLESCVINANYADALSLCEQALTGIEKIYGTGNRFTVELYQSLGIVNYYNGNLDKFIYYTEVSIKYAEIIFNGKHSLIGTGYNNLGLAYWNTGDYDRAIAYYEKALAIYIAGLGEKHPYTATGYNNLGLAFWSKGDYDQAIAYYEKALAIYKAGLGEKHPYTAMSYNNLGLAFWNTGDYDRAIAYYEKALAIRLEILGEKHPDTAQSYNNLGAVYCNKEDYDRTIAYFEKAIAIFIEVLGEKHPEIAMSYNNLGMVYNNKGDYDRAIAYYEKALVIDIEVLGEKHPFIATFYNNLGVTYWYKGDYDRAIAYYEKALALRLEILGEKHPDTAQSYNNLGFVYDIKGNHDRAIAYYDNALKIFEEKESNQEIINVSNNLGSIFFEQNNYKQSYTSFLAGIETIEKVRRLNLSAGTDFTSRNINSFYYAANACFLDRNIENMFNISERMRALGYLERLSLNAAIEAAGIDPEQGKKLLKLKDDIERLSSYRQKLISADTFSMNGQQKKEHDRQLEETGKQLEQAEAEFNKLDTGFMKNEKYRLLRDSSVVSVKAAQSLCGKNGAIIEYIIPGKPDDYMKPYAIVINGSSINAVELDSSYDYSGQVEKYRTLMNAYRKAYLNNDIKAMESTRLIMDKLSNDLYAKLIDPLNIYLNPGKIKRLVIVPDGVLSFLPFDSIKDKDSNYLSELYELSLTASVTVSSMIKNRMYDKRDNFMAMGGGIYSSRGESGTRGQSSFRGIEIGLEDKEKLAAKAYNSPLEYYTAQQLRWADLPGTESEVAAINEKIYGKKNTKIYTGSMVSETNLKLLSKSGALKNFSSILLACHGYYDPEYPAYSAVVFSEVSGRLKDSKDDGYMSVEETALLNLQSDIVVLSACETGLGRMVRGDGVIGLTRAFQVAGSNRVLVTLWPVSDEATEEFMVSFYAKVKSGMSYSQALVKVKEEFRRNGGSGASNGVDYSAPYFWAGFVLYE